MNSNILGYAPILQYICVFVHTLLSSWPYIMALRRRLSELQIPDVKVTSHELGRGSYGVVLEADVNGLTCAAKKLHDFIQKEQDRKAHEYMSGRFVEEMFQHSRMRHPNIVQLLGVYFPSENADFPLMILEKWKCHLEHSWKSFLNVQ